ncbi:Aminotran-1-2 domain-containing protein [Aphelenchoides besseyi]|nr:Aminotran-1-2 domain-containing protein [Aphelenchoides besseyi]
MNVTTRRFLSTARGTLIRQLDSELAAIKNAGTYKKERVILSKQGMEIKVEGQSRPLLNFCANNYLGLSSNPEVIEVRSTFECRIINTLGFETSSRQIWYVRDCLLCANFHDREAAILYASCFDANAGLFEVLTNKDHAILTDELNHASIIDGIRLSKAKRFVFKHMNMEDLESKLKESHECSRRVIVTDGVFSMDGDIAPLKEIFELADRHKALVFLDEAHATGFVGKTGRGTEEAVDLMGRADIINSTLGKALGGALGGYTVGPKELINLLHIFFSNSLAPSVVGAALKVLELLNQDGNPFAKNLKANVKQFRTKMNGLGFNIGGNPEHPICPVLVGDAALASKYADEMLNEGIYVIGFSYPVVPKGKARIRVQISAAHTTEHIEKCIHAFEKIGRKLGVLQ